MTPAVTVVIPTHDRKGLLTLTLRSVLRQRGVDFEVLVVDDGSADGTSEAIASISDERVRVIRQEVPQGVATSRNAGVAEARGQWIALLDDDDLWSPDKLERQLGAAEEVGAAWVYGGVVEIDLQGRLLRGDLPPSPGTLLSQLKRKNLVPAGCSNVMVRTQSVLAVGAFDPGLRHLADWDLWLRLARVGSPAVARSPVVAYRLHTGQATLDPSGMVDEARIVASRHGADPASIYRWLAWSHLRQGRRRNAINAYMRAVGTGDILSVGRIAAALAHPRPTSLRNGRVTPESIAWQEEAAKWLAELRP
jgi:glycosyltransferase involved in cell wall biosynthesis